MPPSSPEQFIILYNSQYSYSGLFNWHRKNLQKYIDVLGSTDFSKFGEVTKKSDFMGLEIVSWLGRNTFQNLVVIVDTAK